MDAAIAIRNFRSIDKASVRIRPGINVLVGPNGSGKSNVLAALKFLSGVLTGGAAQSVGTLGGPVRNFKRGQQSTSFTVSSFIGTFSYKGKQRDHFCRWSIDFALGGDEATIRVKKEILQIKILVDGVFEDALALEIARPLGSVRTKVFSAKAEDLSVALLKGGSWARSGRKEHLLAAIVGQANAAMNLAKELPRDASFMELVSSVHSHVRTLYHDLTSLDEYNIIPDIARASSNPLQVARMGSDGSNASEVLNALESGQFRRLFSPWGYPSNPPYFKGHYSSYYSYSHRREVEKDPPLGRIVEHLCAGVTSIDRLSTETDPFTGKRYVLFHGNGLTFRPNEVSDGTVKWLCLLIAIFVPVSRIILLEEPENFMHPWMQQRLVQLVRDRCSANRSSALMTTHSVTVLNSLQVSELRVVSGSAEGTVVSSVSDVDEIQRILEQSNFGLGDLWVSGGIGGVNGGGSP